MIGSRTRKSLGFRRSSSAYAVFRDMGGVLSKLCVTVPTSVSGTGPLHCRSAADHMASFQNPRP